MKSHLKRIAAPASWHITRKTNKWLVRGLPGAHDTEESFPVAVLIRDVLHYAKTMREVKNILTKKKVMVNGARVKNEKMVVGVMDVVSFPEIGDSFRILISTKGRLFAKKIEKKSDAEVRPFKINNKTIVKGRVQLNFSSGNNLLVEKDVYKTGDTLLISVPKKEIKEHLKMEKGAVVYLVGGSHIGETGTVDSIEGKKIMLKINGQPFETLKEYAFIVGRDKPAIDVGN